MSNLKVIGAALFLVFLTPGWSAAGEPATPIAEKINEQKFLFNYEIDLENKSAHTQVFSVIMPYAEDGNYQKIEYTQLPGDVVDMVDGLGKFIDAVVTLGPKEKKTVACEFIATVYDVETDFSKVDAIYPYDVESEFYRQFTGPEFPYIDPENPRVKEVHDRLAADAKDDLEYARAAFDFVVNEVTYYRRGVHDIGETLRRKSGSCIDLNGAFVSLMRCHGIPARLLTGIQVSTEAHARSEFYLEHYGWIPTDIAYRTKDHEKQFFGRLISDVFAALVTQRYGGYQYMPGDDHGFLEAQPSRGILMVRAYCSDSVRIGKKRGSITKLVNGQPVGEPKRIVTF